VEGLAKKYGLNRCVYYEFYADMDIAMARGKELKQWTREQKIELLESKNPEWNDLKEEIKKLK
jgi:putative endonuclease